MLILCSCRKWRNPYDDDNKINMSVEISKEVVRNHIFDISLSTNSYTDFNVKLELYKGETFTSELANNISCNSKFGWKVPDVGSSILPGSDYRIKAISLIDNKSCWYSDYFSITDWENFNSVPSLSKSSLFIEDFNDNSHGWPSENTADLTILFNGNYYVVTNNSSTLSYFFPNDCGITDYSKNFQIEMCTKYTGGNPNAILGCFWGYLDVNNYFELYYWNPPSGGYGGGKELDSVWQKFWDSKSSSNILNGFNTIVIRKIGGYYYFFSNGKFLDSTSYESVCGNKIGIEVYPNITAYVDYIHVYYLEGL